MKFKILVPSIGLLMSVPLLTIVSCNNNGTIVNNDEHKKLKEALHSYYQSWYESLSKNDWNRNSNGEIIDAISSSEMQSLYLYTNQWGDFWNQNLHLNKEPIDTTRKMKLPGMKYEKELKINGNGYKEIDSSLERAVAPFNFQVKHGVEWLEVEFWDQLKNYITIKQSSNDGSTNYDYSKCVGKTITSYGYISTSIAKDFLFEFAEGKNWITGEYQPPLKEPFLFKINILKGTKGVAYVSDYDLMGGYNTEEQVMIAKGRSYKIKKYYKENKLNIFEMDLIQ